MSGTDLTALLPLIVVAATALVVLLQTAGRRHHGAANWLTMLGLAVALATLPLASTVAPYRVSGLLLVDAYAIFYFGLIFAASLVVAALSYGYFERQKKRPEELYVVLSLATLGSAVLVASIHFVTFFLGLELLSVSLYVMISYVRTARLPLEAGVKYLVLAAASSAFLLFGMALLYARLGTMELGEMARLVSSEASMEPWLLVGLGLLVTGIGYKLALVPFHMWTPDVYEGAPAPVAGFIATVSKGAMFALLLRYFVRIDVYDHVSLMAAFSAIAIASMFLGNLLALLQTNVKRILAYSSIAHLGYLLVALLAGRDLAVEAVTFYLATYFITTLGAFGIVTVLSSSPGSDADAIEDYRGLFWRHPGLAVVFTAMLLSLAGIPLTAGFVGKFYVLAAGVGSALWTLVLSLVVNSAIGLFYYLRIVVAMFSAPTGVSAGATARVSPAPSVGGRAVLAVLTLLVIWFGVYPAPLIRIISVAVESMS